MIRSLSLAAVAIAAALSSAPATAEPVRIGFRGEITYLFGPQSNAFQVGQSAEFSYVIESTAVDSNPSPSAGVFFNALRGLTVTLPAQGINATTGPGTVQTFNDVGTAPRLSDQVFVYGNSMATSSNLAGAPISKLEVDFIDDQSVQDPIPLMLTSDALPLGYLAHDRLTVALTTPLGITYVTLRATPAFTTSELVEDAVDRLKQLTAARQVNPFAATLLTLELQQLLARAKQGSTSLACAELASITRLRERFTVARLISASANAELVAMELQLRASLGGCN